MLHFHISSVLPHEITSTSAIRPYPVALGPADIASQTASDWLPAILSPGGGQQTPAAHQEWQPEEIAAAANRLADAMAAGMEAPAWIDRKLLSAARMIIQGRPFIIKSAGRAIEVRADAPSSWIGIRQQSAPLEGAQPGAAVIRSRAPSSWTGIRRAQPSAVMVSGQAGTLASRAMK